MKTRIHATKTYLLFALLLPLLAGCQPLPSWDNPFGPAEQVVEVEVTVEVVPPHHEPVWSPCSDLPNTMSLEATYLPDGTVRIVGEGFEPYDEPSFRLRGRTENGSMEFTSMPANMPIGIDGHIEYEMQIRPYVEQDGLRLETVEVAVHHSDGTACVPLEGVP